MEKNSIFKILLVGASLLTLTACSLFGPKPGVRDQNFYVEGIDPKDAQAIPVEIAMQIKQISEDGLLVMEKKEERHIACTKAHVDGQKKRRKAKRGLFAGRRNGPLMKGWAKEKGTKHYHKSKGIKRTGGKTVNYMVKLGDTLMKIAFEKHGDYLRWKEIYQVNRDKMKSPRKMQVGTELTIHNVKYVYIKRDGQPYLIKKEDTLKAISKKLYGDETRWKEIWANNPQLIQNPSKIYAGFTLYYKPDAQNNLNLRVPAKANN